MAASLTRPTYRMAGWAVICALVSLGVALAQMAQRTTVSKGPRAVALLRLQANGKAQLIPVSIMVDGKFFDANAYKATPVPMALEGGTVYEAERTGNSLGLFTVTKVVQQKNSWIGDGNWLPAGATPPSTGLKAESQPRQDEDKPPTLRRGSSPPSTERSSDTGKSQTPPPGKSTNTSSGTNDDEDRPRLKSGNSGKDQPPSAPAQTPSAPPTPTPNVAAQTPQQEPEDASRPTLKRGKQPSRAASTTATSKETKTSPTASDKEAKKDAHATGPASTASDVQLVPAISDASGPEPRPYTYEMKAGEEQTFRKKMLTLAGEEIWKQAKLYNPTLATPAKPGTRTSKSGASKMPQPTFQDVKLNVFDVATNNEAILVLTATASLPAGVLKSEGSDQPQPSYFVTLVAHSDMYGELRTLLSAVTDEKHLDVSPRMNLIDAVDADGDGRAELLFEQIFDNGKAYVIYRVGADQLWALYQGSPS